MTKDKVLKLALDFVTSIHPAFICEATHHKKNQQHASNEPCPHVEKQKQTYEAIKEALAQPEQPKVRTRNCLRVGVCASEGHKIAPQRNPLTDKQILADETLRYYFGLNGGAGPVSKQGRKIVNAIEALHNIKETEK